MHPVGSQEILVNTFGDPHEHCPAVLQAELSGFRARV